MLGYWNDPDRHGRNDSRWLAAHRRLGRTRSDGYLRITGRKKELIVTAGGKNIAPVFLESLLSEEPLIHQAIVIGDGRKYLTALIVPNPDCAAGGNHRAADSGVLRRAGAGASRRAASCIAGESTSAWPPVSTCEQIQRFKLLSRAFTAEQEELTPTLKLRRKLIEEHFADEIEALYAE